MKVICCNQSIFSFDNVIYRLGNPAILLFKSSFQKIHA